MGNEQLSEGDAGEVKRRVLLGLKRIHASNIWHSDVVLRNLRVGKDDGKMHVWWIAFGMSTFWVDDNSEKNEPEGEELEQDELEQQRRELVKYGQDRFIDLFSEQSSK